jgi:DNA-binding NarL/FixJ family response regulator
VRGADRPASHSARLRELWEGVAQIEKFSRAAAQLATTMRQAGQPDRAMLYESRAEQARQRVALLTSLLTTIELSYASIESHRAQFAQRRDPRPYQGMVERSNRSVVRRDHVLPKLTRREHQVAALIARGRTNRQIATELVMTPGTAANHVRNILEKFGCRSRIELVVRLVEPTGGDDASQSATTARDEDAALSSRSTQSAR